MTELLQTSASDCAGKEIIILTKGEEDKSFLKRGLQTKWMVCFSYMIAHVLSSTRTFHVWHVYI